MSFNLVTWSAMAAQNQNYCFTLSHIVSSVITAIIYSWVCSEMLYLYTVDDAVTHQNVNYFLSPTGFWPPKHIKFLAWLHLHISRKVILTNTCTVSGTQIIHSAGHDSFVPGPPAAFSWILLAPSTTLDYAHPSEIMLKQGPGDSLFHGSSLLKNETEQKSKVEHTHNHTHFSGRSIPFQSSPVHSIPFHRSSPPNPYTQHACLVKILTPINQKYYY